MTSESESEAESSPPVNYRESKIFFDVLPKESQPLFRHPTPTPKQLKVLKAQRTSYLSQENGATAVPVRPAPGLPAVSFLLSGFSLSGFSYNLSVNLLYVNK